MEHRRGALVGVGVAVVAVVGLGVGGAVWWRWLRRRQTHWQEALAQSIPVNSAYWRQRRAAGERPRTDGAAPIRYVAIGDSAAQGIGASRPGHSYVGFLARTMRRAAGRPVAVTNLAISGATLRIALDRELPALERLVSGGAPPDVVTVCIGANDIADFDAERFDREIRELLDRVPAHAIVADLPSFYFLPGQRLAVVANRLLRAAAAERGLVVVPLHRLTDRQGLWGVTTQFAGDLFHPNDRGYRIWARAFEPAVLARLRNTGMLGAA